MKAIKYTLASMCAAVMLTACSDSLLDTTPTTHVATNELTSNAETAVSLLDGIYRTMYKASYSNNGWTAEEAGLASTILAADLMAEDMVMSEGGSGWFYYDYLCDVKYDYTLDYGRPYSLWNQGYQWISNANLLIAAKETMQGDENDVNYIVGQAYTLRAFGYYMLSQWFARTLVGHEDEPCVPIYTEPTTKKMKGKGRATVAQVYKQIDDDLAAAEAMLENSNHARNSKSHLGLVGTYGIHARVALVEENWTDALKYADKAIEAAKAEGLDIEPVSSFAGMNRAAFNNVIWGMSITADQSTTYDCFLNHMDADMGGYAAEARKQINKQLYAKMGSQDARRSWWNPKDEANGDLGYQQEKFKFSNYSTFEGDNIFMRVEEMYLIKAEAECMLNDDAAAQQTLNKLVQTRDPQYDCSAKTGKTLGTTSAPEEETGSLREEIINQRRIELWGEFGRLFDLRRLHQGYIRTAEQGHSEIISDYRPTSNPESVMWLMPIPQSEFDGNKALDPIRDQNPWEDEIDSNEGE